ncbi:MAG: hypothetical protein Q7K65_02000 [Candidatus Buchananbacteria bacterium]|nr:hypothetical protein [Candidatus Buchananbacteria bacterium]
MDNKKMVWVALGLVVLAGLVWWLVSSNKSQDPTPVTNTDSTVNTPAPTPTPPPVATAPKSNNANYNADLIKYGTNRIQFQENCQSVPNNMVFKNGTAVMLDNRASIQHVVKIDSKSYTIGAYNYTTITLSNSKLPHTILVDCDKSQNVATILLEK